MKEIKQVRGTMTEVSLFEVSVDTVYIRTNVKRIEEDADEGFHGWEYDEVQYTLQEYIRGINDLGQYVTDLELRLLEMELGV